MTAEASGEPDPGVFLSRLREFEWWLFRGVVISRVAVVAGLGVILGDERAVHGDRVFVIIVIAWLAALAWVAVPLLSIRRVFHQMKARPGIVWLDVGALALLLAVGGGWRNPFYLYAWSAFGLASVVWSARRTALLVILGWGFQLASFVAWHTAGSDPAARHVAARAWVSPLLGYAVVGALFGYVRRRYDDLEEAATAYAVVATEAIVATRGAAAVAEGEELAYRLHSRLRQVFPAFGLRLGALEPAGDGAVAAELHRLSAAVAEADSALDAVLRRLQDAALQGGEPIGGPPEQLGGPA